MLIGGLSFLDHAFLHPFPQEANEKPSKKCQALRNQTGPHAHDNIPQVRHCYGALKLGKVDSKNGVVRDL